jgi:hypothetical protein
MDAIREAAEWDFAIALVLIARHLWYRHWPDIKTMLSQRWKQARRVKSGRAMS